jgi:hypothetical protein
MKIIKRCNGACETLCPHLSTIAYTSPQVCLTLDYHALYISTSFKFLLGEKIIKRCNGRAKRNVHICPLLPITAHQYVLR